MKCCCKLSKRMSPGVEVHHEEVAVKLDERQVWAGKGEMARDSLLTVTRIGFRAN